MMDEQRVFGLSFFTYKDMDGGEEMTGRDSSPPSHIYVMSVVWWESECLGYGGSAKSVNGLMGDCYRH